MTLAILSPVSACVALPQMSSEILLCPFSSFAHLHGHAVFSVPSLKAAEVLRVTCLKLGISESQDLTRWKLGWAQPAPDMLKNRSGA